VVTTKTSSPVDIPPNVNRLGYTSCPCEYGRDPRKRAQADCVRLLERIGVSDMKKPCLPLPKATISSLFLFIAVSTVFLSFPASSLTVSRLTRVDNQDPSASRSAELAGVAERSVAYVAAIDGTAVALEETDQGLKTKTLRTTRAVFKAFGLAADRRTLLYSPLAGGIPSGELYIENLEVGQPRKVSPYIVLEAAWSPVSQNEIAYTFSRGFTFGLAVVELDSGNTRILVAEHVLPDLLHWSSDGGDIYYFEVDESLERPILSTKTVSVQSGISREPTQSDSPTDFPGLASNVATQTIRNWQDTRPFSISAPDGVHHIRGDDLLADGPLYLDTNVRFATAPVAKGQLLKALSGGFVVKVFTEEGVKIQYVPWNGQAMGLGPAVAVTFNLPMKNFILTQGGASYPPPGACSISSHTGSLSFAYDMQRPVVGEHVLASAAGQVVLVTSTVTCNSAAGPSCPDYSASCPSGFGNTVVIQHADGTFTRYAHMQPSSVQVAEGAAVCQGQYIGRQGHTGQTCCIFNQCGDHLHFQRQQLSSGASISVSFSDVASNPLSCGGSSTSGSTETTSCSTCRSGSSESYRAFGSRPPVHPNGSLIKVSGDPTVYLLRAGQKMPIISSNILSNLYQQANSDFSNDVITVASDELNRYPTGSVISGTLPSNGRGQSEGRLIRQSGGTEVSIVTDGGHRRPFSTQEAFLGLGYVFCRVVEVGDYFSYPQGPFVEAMPIVTSSIVLSPPPPYGVGQTANGTFALTNIGSEPITLAVMTIGGRLNGDTVRDFPFHTNFTLSPGHAITYQDSFLFSQAGTYSFFPAYQTQDGVWRIGLNHEIPTDPGLNDLVIFNVTTSCSGPGAFSLTSPSNGQNLSSTSSVTLSWGTSANANSYDVYFGTGSNPPFLANQASASRSVSVTPGQTYFWKVVARVNCDASRTFTAGVWSFSVQPSCSGPGAFSLTSPSNGQNLSSTSSVSLSWGTSANANSYDVYFGTSSNPPFLANQTSASRSVSVTPGQTYFWKVVAGVNCGSSLIATSGVWSFAVRLDTLEPGLRVDSAIISGKHLMIIGQAFSQGAAIYLNGQRQKTINDRSNPSGVLKGKKVAKRISAGQTVMLQVLNVDGMASNLLRFTRPAGSGMEVSVDPNPVSPSLGTCGDATPAWGFEVTVSANGSTGITVSSFTWDFYDGDGNYLNTQTNTGDTFADWFSACGARNSRVGPNGQACGRLCVSLGGRNSGSVILTFFGTDDQSRSVVISSARIVLQSSPLMTTADASSREIRTYLVPGGRKRGSQ
jgi:murein DD-endopeptidase MepM/ murein hydrolase activator NlpD